MSLDQLAYDFLSRLNAGVKRKVTVVLIGGNALSFLGLKGGTIDVDIVCRSSELEVKKFCQEYLKKYKVKVEFFVDGLFVSIRIRDYLKKAYPVELKEFPNLNVFVLNVYDVVLTKINRSLKKDIDDIIEVFSKGKLSRSELDARFKVLYKFTLGGENKANFFEKYQKVINLYGILLQP